MAESIKRHIEHIKSNVTVDGAPKLPTASQLHLGEIAINYAKGYETLSIKNESGDVVTFKASNYYSSATEVSQALQGKADTATTLGGYGITDASISNGTITLGSNTITPLTELPSNVVTDNSYVHTDNNFTTTLKNKLDSVESGANVNVQADWEETDDTADSYILNKPTLGTAAAKGVANDISSGSDNLTMSKTVYGAISGLANASDTIASATYDSNDKKIYFKNPSNVTLTSCTIDATDFIKDGMVSAVTVTGGNLVITFNEDAGRSEDISIPLTDIFDPSNYYNTAQTSSSTEISTALNAKADTATTLGGYGITDAKIENGVITLGNQTITPLTSYTAPVTSVTTSSTNGSISVNGSDVAIHGLGGAAYLDTGTTAGTVAAGDHTHSGYIGTARTISTASGLTGGGDLSQDRTLGLETVGTAGTYYRVVVDAYGRVTSGNTTDANSTTHLYVGTTATTSGNTATSNPYLKVFDTSTLRDKVQLSGSNISINSTTGGVATFSAITGTTTGTVAAGSHSHNLAQTYASGATSVTNVIDTPLIYKSISVTGNLTNQTCPVTLVNGQSCTVIYYNNATAHTVSISTSYKTPDGAQITLSLAANGYGEVNYLMIGNMTFARGI